MWQFHRKRLLQLIIKNNIIQKINIKKIVFYTKIWITTEGLRGSSIPWTPLPRKYATSHRSKSVSLRIRKDLIFVLVERKFWLEIVLVGAGEYSYFRAVYAMCPVRLVFAEAFYRIRQLFSVIGVGVIRVRVTWRDLLSLILTFQFRYHGSKKDFERKPRVF